ncbi:alkaline phosphatase D family protein [Variovorax sp. DT-64]|uniref:alkaline phosphatase D family protein n=1 Tax=Variovorax sp. DT-64 TaxID=3396160 RepID=UPI003F1AA585
MNLRRRDLNRAALWLALCGWSSVRPARAQPAPRWRSNPFTLGVASGRPRPDSIVLWTRLAAGDEPGLEGLQRCAVRYEVFGDAELKRPVLQGEVQAEAAHAFSVHVHAQGLAPQREYWYRFSCGDARSPVGRTRTAPAADAAVSRLRFALASCQNYEHGYYAAHRDIATRELDFVLFAGDYIYEGSSQGPVPRRHGAPIPVTLEEYRARHALYKRDADLQAAHAAHPWILTWDDHEVVNDYANDRDPAYTEPALFLQRRAAAYRAYFEHMPLLLPPQGAAMRIHDRFAWGRLAELWTLDTRQYRSHHACPDPAHDWGRLVIGCEALADPSRTMLGAEQSLWLAQGLASSGRQWKLLGQSTQMSPTSLEAPRGRQFWTDGWDGYPEARRQLLQGLGEGGIRDVVVLGGDVHRFVAADLRVVPNDTASPVVASEFVGGSISSRGASRKSMEWLQRDNPDVVHARGDERGYALIEATPKAMHCEFRATAHPVAVDAPFHTQASFAVEAGRAGVKAA